MARLQGRRSTCAPRIHELTCRLLLVPDDVHERHDNHSERLTVHGRLRAGEERHRRLTRAANRRLLSGG